MRKLQRRYNMRNFLPLCCVETKHSRSNEQVLHVSSTMRLDNYGRLTPTASCSKGKNKSTKLSSAEMPPLPDQPLQTNNDHSDVSIPGTDFDSAQSVLSKHLNNNDPKKEIGIQAGSPLGSKSKKTKTTLSITTDKSILKNPWRPARSDHDTLKLEKPSQTKRDLAPLKKPNMSKKKATNILQPVDETAITNKLVPVDKAFLLRLEIENKEKIKTDRLPADKAAACRDKIVKNRKKACASITQTKPIECRPSEDKITKTSTPPDKEDVQIIPSKILFTRSDSCENNKYRKHDEHSDKHSKEESDSINHVENSTPMNITSSKQIGITSSKQMDVILKKQTNITLYKQTNDATNKGKDHFRYDSEELELMESIEKEYISLKV